MLVSTVLPKRPSDEACFLIKITWGIMRLATILGLILLAVIGYTTFMLSNAAGTLIITSDAHVSDPQGRWPWTTAQYQAFLKSLDNPEIVFHVGDFVDNVKIINSGVTAGGLDHWRREVDLYRGSSAQAFSKQQTTFLHSLGPGHDWIRDVSIEEAERYAGVPRRGVHRWGNVDLIWFTVYPAAFNNTGKNRPSLKPDDYSWLNQQLSSTRNAILLWHVPIRTAKTYSDGQWPGNRNLSIPENDKLYSIINKYKDRINVIFNGHIHKPSRSDYNGIPVYLCPFFQSGCHCELNQNKVQISIRPKQCNLPSEQITMKNVGPVNRSIIPIIELLLSD